MAKKKASKKKAKKKVMLRLLVPFSGPGVNLKTNDEAEFTADEAERLLEKGYAQPVRGPKTESATSR